MVRVYGIAVIVASGVVLIFGVYLLLRFVLIGTEDADSPLSYYLGLSLAAMIGGAGGLYAGWLQLRPRQD
jgi:hypothetical protein